jgi:GxxExxY protein
VYNELGPGLLESVYEAALLYQLRKDGLQVENQKILNVYYDGNILPIDFRLDIIVEDKVIIELKSVEMLKDLHKKQLLTYLKISGKKVGLLVNFNTNDLTKNIVRIVNGL